MNLTEFKQLNKKVGNHWFSPETLHFFKSKIHTWDCVTGYFITSEIALPDKKRFTVRKAIFSTGRVETIGEFFSHESLKDAKQALKAICPTADTRTK